MNLQKLFEQAHNTIHSIHDEFIDEMGEKHKIYKSNNGCRATDILLKNGPNSKIVCAMEQNPSKNSAYAQRARKGEAITWLMVQSGEWGLVENGKLTKLPQI